MGKKGTGWCFIGIGVLVILFLSTAIGAALVGTGIAQLIKASKEEKEGKDEK